MGLDFIGTVGSCTFFVCSQHEDLRHVQLLDVSPARDLAIRAILALLHFCELKSRGRGVQRLGISL